MNLLFRTIAVIISLIVIADIPASGGRCLAPPGFAVVKKEEPDQVEKEILAWKERTKDVEPYLTEKAMLETVERGPRWKRAAKNNEQVLCLLKLLLKKMNRGRKKSLCKELSDITTANMASVTITEIGKPISGLLNYYKKQTDENTLKAGLRFMRRLLEIEKVVKPYESIEEMLEVFNNGHPDWERVVKRDEHVLYFFNLLLDEINKGKEESQHLEFNDIGTRLMWRTQITEIDGSLWGLLNWYRKQTDEKTYKAGLSRMREYLKKQGLIIADKELRALLEEIYIPYYDNVKERDIEIYMMHNQGMNSHEIKTALKEKDMIFSIDRIRRIIKKIRQVLKAVTEKEIISIKVGKVAKASLGSL